MGAKQSRIGNEYILNVYNNKSSTKCDKRVKNVNNQFIKVDYLIIRFSLSNNENVER